MASWTNKRRKFVEEYFRCGMNATEAARRAKYAHPNVAGAKLVKVSIIKEEIERRLAELAMDADEVLRRLGEQARASADDFIEVDDEGGWKYDLAHARDEGKLHLIKKLWTDKDGNTRLELHDAQAALVHIGRHHKLFTDMQEHDIGPRLQDVLAALPDEFREAVRGLLAESLSAGGSGTGSAE